MSQVVSEDTYPSIIIIFLEKVTKLILAFLDHIIFIKNKLVKILDFSKVVVILICKVKHFKLLILSFNFLFQKYNHLILFINFSFH